MAETISYNQLVDHLETADNEDNQISDDLYKFRALIGHQGPSRQQIPIGKGTNTMSLLIGRLGEASLRHLRLVVFLGELNNLELWGPDIGNDYLEAYPYEKLFIIAGAEFE